MILSFNFPDSFEDDIKFKENSPVSIHFDTSNFTPEKIACKPLSQNVKFKDGVVINSQQAIDTSEGASFNFQFLPGDESQYKIAYTVENSSSYNITNGVTTSSSTTDTKSTDVTVSIGVEVGLPKIDEAKVSTSIEHGLQSAWEHAQSVDFSKSQTTTSVQSTDQSITAIPGTATKNSDGTYRYSHSIEQPDGSITTNVAGFIPALYYTAHVTRTITQINNPLSADFNISGSSGSIKDSAGNTVAFTAAEAVNQANQFNYPAIADYSVSQFGELSEDKLSIPFTGTATGTASVETSWTLTYVEDSSQNSTSSSMVENTTSPTPSSRKSSRKHYIHTDLKDYDSSTLDEIGVSHVYHKKSEGYKSISGTGHSDIVRASKKGNHKFLSFNNSFLHGNNRRDKYILNENSSGNNIESFGGDDLVRSSSTQAAHLGSGNDRYKISPQATKNSIHTIMTGDGRDQLIIGSNKAKFIIGDFHPLEDKIVIGGNLNPTLLSSRLKSNTSDLKSLDNARIDFKYKNRKIGTAHLSSDEYIVNTLSSPKFYQDLVELNPSLYDDKNVSAAISDSNFAILSTLIENGMIHNKVLFSGE